MRHTEETLRKYHQYVPNHLRLTMTALLLLMISLFPTQNIPAASTLASDHALRIASYVKEKDEHAQVLSALSEKSNRLQEQVVEVAVGEKRFVPTPTPVNRSPWGKSEQIDEHTWTIRVQDDSRNASADEILQALNAYRQKHGSGALQKDDKLTTFAQSRSDFFDREKKLDSHAGFQDYINNQDGFSKLGFNALGENSSFGFTLEGVHLIEWVYAGDKPHDDNQKNPQWTHVGIGVTGTATNLIFAGKKR